MWENTYVQRLSEMLESLEQKITTERKLIKYGEIKKDKNLKKMLSTREYLINQLKNAEKNNVEIIGDTNPSNDMLIISDEFKKFPLVDFGVFKFEVPTNKVEDFELEISNYLQAVLNAKQKILDSDAFEKKDAHTLGVLSTLENTTISADVQKFIKAKKFNAMYSVYLNYKKMSKGFVKMENKNLKDKAELFNHTGNLIMEELFAFGYKARVPEFEECVLFIDGFNEYNKSVIKNEKIKGFIVNSKPSKENIDEINEQNKLLIITSKSYAKFKKINWKRIK
ncbi:hypothetical protein [Mesoplasma photuris]|uniref:hypothetical protein n=1 Tax=Mesoplasma photuris TaxID=217731 RepID=UPI0004E194E9|nr:hypothetical protein [Mesoplasma photuris]